VPRITIRVEPRGPVEQRDVDAAFLEAPPEITLDNGLVGVFDRVDDNGDFVYVESLVLPKGHPGPRATT
jgi:hypothetical protein